MGLEWASLGVRTGRVRLVVGLLAAVLAVGLLSAGRAAADTVFDQSVTTTTLPSGADTGDTWATSAEACGTGAQCVGVGYYQHGSGTAPDLAMVLPINDGIPGPAVAVPLPANAIAADSSALIGVSCQGADSCTAVGRYTDSSDEVVPMVVQITNGVPATAVQILPPSNAVNDYTVTVAGVSCPSSGLCVAVGTYTTGSSLVEALVVPINSGVPATGVEVALPSNVYAPAPDGDLYDVACQGSGPCTAIGRYQDASSYYAPMSVVISAGVPATAVEGTVPAQYNGHVDGWDQHIGCPASGACEALGVYFDSSDTEQLMVVPVSDGSFGTPTEFSLASPQSIGDVDFYGLSCSSASLCVAAGEYEQTSQQWVNVVVPITPAGATTDVLAPPSGVVATAQYSSGFYAVACLASGPCLDAGWEGVGTLADPLYNPVEEQVSAAGTVGASLRAPAPSNANTTAPNTYLDSVACSPVGACAAVGASLDTSGAFEPYVINEQPLVLITTTDPLPAAQVGAAFTDTFTATGGWGPGSYTWAATGLPPGLTLNPQTGVFSGTPTVAGSYTVNFSVSGSGPTPPTETAHFMMVVDPAGSRIKLLKTSTVVKSNHVPAELLCGLATCNGLVKLERTVKVTIKKGKKRVHKQRTVVLGSTSYTAAAGKIIKLEVALNSAGRRALAAAKHHRLKITLVATVKNGAPSTRSETVHAVVKRKKK